MQEHEKTWSGWNPLGDRMIMAMGGEQSGAVEVMQDVLASLGQEDVRFLGKGMHGCACLLSDGSVLKFTTQAEEAASCLALMDAAQDMGEEDGLMEVYALVCLGEGTYAVVRENAVDLPMPADKASMDWLDGAFNHMSMEWGDRSQEWCGYHAWIAELERQENSMAPMLRAVWDSLERLQDVGIEAADIGFQNMGMLSCGKPTLRDLSVSDAPSKAMTKVEGMQPGDIIVRRKPTSMPGCA